MSNVRDTVTTPCRQSWLRCREGVPLLIGIICICLGLSWGNLACGEVVLGSMYEESFETPETIFSIGHSDVEHKVLEHRRSTQSPHRGSMCERFCIQAGSGTSLQLQMPIGQVALIDELAGSLWVRCNRSRIRLSMNVVLPNTKHPTTGRPLMVIIPGTLSVGADRYEMLEVNNIPREFEKGLRAIRAEFGSHIDPQGAAVTHLVLDLYSGPGNYELSIDDLALSGAVTRPLNRTETDRGASANVREVMRDSAVRTISNEQTLGQPDRMTAGISRGVLEADGRPLFPRILDYHGESLEAVRALGFNGVRLTQPASVAILDQARATGLWIVCPPPNIGEIDSSRPESMPTFSSAWDRVLMWDLGNGLSNEHIDALAERSRVVRACDTKAGRPVIVSAESDLRTISRHIDMLVTRRTVLGTSLELTDYLSWLKQRPRLVRPGTPLLAGLSTEIDSAVTEQCRLLSGLGANGIPVDSESLHLAGLAAVAAGSRGLFFSSDHRIDGREPEARRRASAVRELNLDLEILEPWGAAGRFAAAAKASNPEVQAYVLEVSRARMVIVFRSVQGSQIVPRTYQGDLPRDSDPITLLVPGVPEAHQSWEIAPGGLRPLRQHRVSGGVSIVLDPFKSSTLILISGEPVITGAVQRRLASGVATTLESSRTRASIAIEDARSLAVRLPASAIGHLPVTKLIEQAQADITAGESLALNDPSNAIIKFRRASSIICQLERLTWERGVLATGSMVASPLSASDSTLAEHWQLVDALASTHGGKNLLPAGNMESIDSLARSGWRHFALDESAIVSGVEISKTSAASGSGSLRMLARSRNPEESPSVVETPPVWITTPPIAVPSGQLIAIEARVWVPKPIQGTVDGLLVFDSWGGPALAERVGVTPGWRHMVLYRIAPETESKNPLTVTFALCGMGEARIDDVRVRPLEPGAEQTDLATVSTVSTAPPLEKADLLSGPSLEEKNFSEAQGSPAGIGRSPNTAPPQAPSSAIATSTDSAVPAAPSPPIATGTAQQWPGMSLGWPKLLPFTKPDAPPPGPGGGTVDPFKRARPQTP